MVLATGSQIPPEDIFELLYIWSACTIVTRRHYTVTAIGLGIYGLATLCTRSLLILALAIGLVSLYLVSCYMTGDEHQIYRRRLICSHVEQIRGVVLEIERLQSLRTVQHDEAFVSRKPILQDILRLREQIRLQDEAEVLQRQKVYFAFHEARKVEAAEVARRKRVELYGIEKAKKANMRKKQDREVLKDGNASEITMAELISPNPQTT
jgi:hypothetical protein